MSNARAAPLRSQQHDNAWLGWVVGFAGTALASFLGWLAAAQKRRSEDRKNSQDDEREDLKNERQQARELRDTVQALARDLAAARETNYEIQKQNLTLVGENNRLQARVDVMELEREAEGRVFLLMEQERRAALERLDGLERQLDDARKRVPFGSEPPAT